MSNDQRSMNRAFSRGKPLLSFEVIVNLIAATTTAKGLKVRAELDSGTYPAGTKIEDYELAGVRLRCDKFHGDWNYEIHPTISRWILYFLTDLKSPLLGSINDQAGVDVRPGECVVPSYRPSCAGLQTRSTRHQTWAS